MITNALYTLKSTTRILVAISLIATLQFVFVSKVLAIQTNVNEVTDLFDQHIENKDALFDNLKAQNNNAINEIESKVGVNSIEGIGDAEGKAAELNNIKETDLDNAGRGARASEEYRFYDESELEPDYTKAGNSEHKSDGDEIIALTDKKMNEIGMDFMAKLKEEGFDCKTVKGSVVKEPVYYIETKKENQKNTKYDQIFCEELRNSYNCKDTLTTRCKRRGKRWTSQNKEIIVRGGSVWWEHLNWFRAERRSISKLALILRQEPHVIEGLRSHISKTTNTPIVNIDNIHYSPAGEGDYSNNHIFRIHYQIRTGYEVCEEWQDDWTERCYIK